MILNYLRFAIRLLVRSPFFAFINVLGLSVGFAVFLILWQYSQRELHSDRFHKDWERIVRLVHHVNDVAYNEKISGVHPAYEKQLAAAIPELSDYVRICNQNLFRAAFTGDHGQDVSLSRIINDRERIAFPEYKLAYADHNLFSYFGIPLIEGDERTILKEPTAIALSRDLAIKYFGNGNAMGETLLLNDSIPLTVTGIFENLPSNSHMDFQAVMSMSRIEMNLMEMELADDAWFPCYFKLPPDTDRQALIKKIDQQKKQLLSHAFESLNWDTGDWRVILQPLSEVVFERAKGDEFPLKSKLVLSVFSCISIVVLVMAWINYINLTLSANRKRVQEIATRLSIGAMRHQFVTQFMTEATLLNLISLIGAMTFVQLLRTPCEAILGIQLPAWHEMSTSSIAVMSGVVVMGIIASGLYPALTMIRRTPSSLFGNVKHKSLMNRWSDALTVVQFSTAIVLVVWIFGVFLQMRYVLNQNLGFRKNEVVIIDFPYLVSRTFETDRTGFMNALADIPGVEHYASSSSVPGDNDPNGIVLRSEDNVYLVGSNGGVDEHFLDFYEMALLAGRNFSFKNPADARGIVVSKRLTERMGFSSPAAAVGAQLHMEHEDWDIKNLATVTVIGVVDDYKRMPSLNGFQAYIGDKMGTALTYGTSIKPSSRARKLSVLIGRERLDGAMKEIEALFHSSFHGSLFNWYFLDEHMARHYRNEKIIRNQILLFTSLAVAIACLGLLGTMMNKVMEKTKEVGIRKVLGASVGHVATILISTTLMNVLVAILVGVPAAIFIMNRYLEKFTDRLSLQWWHFLLPVVLLALVMSLTIFVSLRRAVRANPVESLRYE